MWVVGVEGRAAWSSLNSKTPGRGIDATGTIFPIQFTVGNDFLASATARVGHSFASGWLVYARGGVAWTRENADVAFVLPFRIPPGVIILGPLPPPLVVDPRATTTQIGWTAGTGVEWAFAPHWSTNFEYDFYEFGGNDFVLTDTVHRATFTGNLKDRIHTVTVGLNYRF